MAGRYLLIEFDDEATANKLRAQIDSAAKGGKAYRVIGLFAKPSSFCRCGSKKVTDRSGEARTKRGRRFGWVVCLDCRKPTTGMHLTNLVKPWEIINPFRFMVPHWKSKALPDNEVGHYPLALSMSLITASRFDESGEG